MEPETKNEKDLPPNGSSMPEESPLEEAKALGHVIPMVRLKPPREYPEVVHELAKKAVQTH